MKTRVSLKYFATDCNKDNTLHKSGRTAEKKILLRTPKTAEIDEGNLAYFVLCLQDAAPNLTTKDPNEILYIEE